MQVIPLSLKKTLANDSQMYIIDTNVQIIRILGQGDYMKDYKSQYRSWIINYFENHENEIVSASSLLEKMRGDGLTINQATVYRNLDRLECSGLIQGHRLDAKEEKYYQYLKEGHDCQHHLHLYCRSCGSIIHLDCEFMRSIQDHLLKDHRFTLDCGDSVLVGLCEDCRKKGKTQS